MLEDEVDDESDVEALVVSRDDYAVLVLVFHSLFLFLFLSDSDSLN